MASQNRAQKSEQSHTPLSHRGGEGRAPAHKPGLCPSIQWLGRSGGESSLRTSWEAWLGGSTAQGEDTVPAGWGFHPSAAPHQLCDLGKARSLPGLRFLRLQRDARWTESDGDVSVGGDGPPRDTHLKHVTESAPLGFGKEGLPDANHWVVSIGKEPCVCPSRGHRGRP